MDTVLLIYSSLLKDWWKGWEISIKAIWSWISDEYYSCNWGELLKFQRKKDKGCCQFSAVSTVITLILWKYLIFKIYLLGYQMFPINGTNDYLFNMYYIHALCLCLLEHFLVVTMLMAVTLILERIGAFKMCPAFEFVAYQYLPATSKKLILWLTFLCF